MAYDIERIGNDNILYIDLQAPVDTDKDLPAIYEETAQLARKMNPPIYRIVDLNNTDMSFGDVVSILQGGARSGEEGALHDWRFKPIFVGSDDMSKLFVDSLKQDQYGKIESRLFTSRDGAVRYAKQQLQSTK